MKKFDSSPLLDRDALEKLSLARPFHRWLGMTVIAVDERGIEIEIGSREEIMSNPELQSTHGGILATLVDTAAGYTVITRLGRGAPTIDLRVDYHKPAKPGVLRARGTLISYGATIAVAEAKVYAGNNMLVASGRGVYLTVPGGSRSTVSAAS
jgi:uncharacterized protein (TIGR00369 family)